MSRASGAGFGLSEDTEEDDALALEIGCSSWWLFAEAHAATPRAEKNPTA
ncbi:MAG: hypothetical protein U0271_43490 [Polyangiaceae bacterium]